LKRASEYTRALRDQFPNDIGPDDGAPDALEIYREALRGQPDHSVVICSVGAFSNLAALCRVDLELIQRKVRHLVVMGGQIPAKETPEVNIASHVEAARHVATHWPGKIFWQGFRVGHPVMTGNGLQRTPASNPVRRAYELRRFGGRFAIHGGQPSYDQAAGYFAVRGPLPELWTEREGGRVMIDDAGFCSYQEDGAGQHILVTRSCPPAELAKLIETLMIAPPAKNAANPTARHADLYPDWAPRPDAPRDFTDEEVAFIRHCADNEHMEFDPERGVLVGGGSLDNHRLTLDWDGLQLSVPTQPTTEIALQKSFKASVDGRDYRMPKADEAE
jgi:hypothetical protein